MTGAPARTLTVVARWETRYLYNERRLMVGGVCVGHLRRSPPKEGWNRITLYAAWTPGRNIAKQYSNEAAAMRAVERALTKGKR
jgi:hypothetical protein